MKPFWVILSGDSWRRSRPAAPCPSSLYSSRAELFTGVLFFMKAVDLAGHLRAQRIVVDCCSRVPYLRQVPAVSLGTAKGTAEVNV